MKPTRKGIMQPIYFANGTISIFCSLTKNQRRYIRNYPKWTLVTLFTVD